MRRPGWRSGLVLAMLAVAMLAATGTADAKKKKKHKVPPVVTATATASSATPGQVISATATCPSGTQAIGGGFSTPPLPPSPQIAGFGTASHKVAANQWLASVEVIGSPGPPVVLTTYAYCRKGAPVTTPVSAATAVPQSSGSSISVASANASCPSNRVQVSGGFDVGATSGDSSLQVLPVATHSLDALTWQASAAAGEAGHTITSQADCAAKPKAKKGKKKKKKKIVAPTEMTGDTPSNAAVINTTAVATCPPNKLAVNGGFSQPGVESANPAFFFLITESQAVGNTWHVSGFDEGGGPGTLRSHVYCSR